MWEYGPTLVFSSTKESVITLLVIIAFSLIIEFTIVEFSIFALEKIWDKPSIMQLLPIIAPFSIIAFLDILQFPFLYYLIQ